MKIKFVTNFSCFGGSTISLIEHCKLLDSAGYDVELYGDCDWHLQYYHKSKLKKNLVIDEEDILIFHFIEMPERPKCKKCFLYVHEQNIFDLRQKNISGYDQILFVSEKQKQFHQVGGIIMPNPIYSLVDPALHNPPNKNIAGILGTIQSRKRQHVSIKQALQDGCEKILLFGDKEDSYFQEHVYPLLSDRVVYMGLQSPEKRMEMYNQFDKLYIFSSDESASLVLGECKILKKDIVKGFEVNDYDIITNSSIVSKWKSLFEKTIVSDLVCVLTHNRTQFIDKWLRAWNNSNKLNCKIAVLHAHDNELPEENERQNVLKHNPDYYIPFKNDPELKDLHALICVLQEKFSIPDWEYLHWFTDDMLPMRKSFLEPFMKIKKEGVGLVAQCYEPRSISGSDAHIRTVAYSIKKEVANKLTFPEVGTKTEKPYFFEHGKKGVYENHILNQVKSMGYRLELCHSEPDSADYQHWTSYLDWMWDCHLLGHWDHLEHVYQDQFNQIERRSDITSKKETLISFEDFEEFSLIKDRVSAIIPTSNAPLENLIWSIFSLLIKSDPITLDHLIVAINGPDSRTGDTSIQDQKQSFLEELRSLKWNSRDMPITIMRTWSRLGHAQTVEQCIPWVHTEFYLCMHDDIIVLKDWTEKTKEFKNKKVLLAYWDRPIIRGLNPDEFGRLELPHFSSIFTLCKKSRMRAINADWVGHYVPLDFKIDNLFNYEEFINWHKKNNFLDFDRIPSKEYNFKFLTMDIGGAFIPDIFNKNLIILEFDKKTIYHFCSMSWCDEKRKKEISEGCLKEIIDLERQIFKYDASWWNLYKKYTEPRMLKKVF